MKNDIEAEFHDCESEDIYDLFNACNGALRDGLPDLSMLDSYSAEERRVLNTGRLKRIWAHMAGGCSHCSQIVAALTQLRTILRQDSDSDIDCSLDPTLTNWLGEKNERKRVR